MRLTTDGFYINNLMEDMKIVITYIKQRFKVATLNYSEGEILNKSNELVMVMSMMLILNLRKVMKLVEL